MKVLLKQQKKMQMSLQRFSKLDEEERDQLEDTNEFLVSVVNANPHRWAGCKSLSPSCQILEADIIMWLTDYKNILYKSLLSLLHHT